MDLRPRLLPLLALGLALAACSEPPPPDPEPRADEPAAAVEETPPALTAEELAAIALADERRTARARSLFGPAMEPLTEAVEAYDEHDSLDESTWFGRDQADNLERIDDLLDDAIAVLGSSEIATAREELRQLEVEIAALEQQRIEDREARLGAPSEEELGALERPFTDSREELDERLEEAARGIEDRRARIEALHVEFVTQMRAIGVELDLDSARGLLSSVTGDDFVEMCVVFDNVRGVTLQLQELTEQSGESLDAARRYYGVYVVLIRMMDRIQRDFVRRVEEEMIPGLEQYAEEARVLIEEAEDNMRRGGDPGIGRQNIASNEVTIQACDLYVQYLRGQAAEVRAQNERLAVDLRDAENTYRTVVLSSEVAALLREGSRNFAALLELDVPDLRGFENAELEAEFLRLTRRLRDLN